MTHLIGRELPATVSAKTATATSSGVAPPMSSPQGARAAYLAAEGGKLPPDVRAGGGFTPKEDVTSG